jgi:hypothetical protein
MSIAKLPLLHDGRVPELTLLGLKAYHKSILCMQRWLDKQDPNWWKYYTIYHFQEAVEKDQIRPERLNLLYQYSNYWFEKYRLFTNFTGDMLATCYAFFKLDGDLKYPFDNDSDFQGPDNTPIEQIFKNSVMITNLQIFLETTILSRPDNMKNIYGSTKEEFKRFYDEYHLKDKFKNPKSELMEKNQETESLRWMTYYFYLLDLNSEITKSLAIYAEDETLSSAMTSVVKILQKQEKTKDMKSLIDLCQNEFPKFRNTFKILDPDFLATLYYATGIKIYNVNYSQDITVYLLYRYFTRAEDKISKQPINGLRTDDMNNYLFWFLKEHIPALYNCSDIQCMNMDIYPQKREISELNPSVILKSRFDVHMNRDKKLEKTLLLCLENAIDVKKPYVFAEPETKLSEVTKNPEEKLYTSLRKDDDVPLRPRQKKKSSSDDESSSSSSSEDEDLRQKQRYQLQKQQQMTENTRKKKQSVKKETTKVVDKMNEKGYLINPQENTKHLQKKLERDVDKYLTKDEFESSAYVSVPIAYPQPQPPESIQQPISRRRLKSKPMVAKKMSRKKIQPDYQIEPILLQNAALTKLMTSNGKQVYVTVTPDPVPNQYFYIARNKSRNNNRRVYWNPPGIIQP